MIATVEQVIGGLETQLVTSEALYHSFNNALLTAIDQEKQKDPKRVAAGKKAHETLKARLGEAGYKAHQSKASQAQKVKYAGKLSEWGADGFYCLTVFKGWDLALEIVKGYYAKKSKGVATN